MGQGRLRECRISVAAKHPQRVRFSRIEDIIRAELGWGLESDVRTPTSLLMDQIFREILSR
jgi:hypothetical protein